jgi:glycosyltransferase involved in cell wall biosynthesis
MLATLTYANIAAVIARRIAGVSTRVTVREANALTREAAGATEMKDRQLPRGARWFYPWADAIVAVSAGAADSLVEATGMSRDRVHVLDNPVVTDDLAALAAEPVDHPWLTTENDRPVIVAAGRLTAQKDFPTLLRAFAIVRARRPARLLVLGEGELREPLEQLVRELGIVDDVCMPGIMRNPFAYMSRATLFVLSSAWEGSPGVLIQAMASGAPVVATDCESGPREILRGGEYGPLVTVGDVGGLAAAIEATLALPRRSPPPSSWHRFSIETSVDAYLKVLGIC